MSYLRLEGIEKRFGAVGVVHGVDIEAEKGEFVVFVGPSGCGKSTLLRMIAGLEEVSGGEVFIDGARVTHTEPAKRQVSMVFQSYALFPHMSVRDNIGFGLKMSKVPKAEIAKQVAEAARILQMESLLDRKPRQLSGGQRQRPRDRAASEAVPVRRAAVEPRRRTTRPDAGRDRPPAS